MKRFIAFVLILICSTTIAQIPYGSNTKVGKRIKVDDITMYYETYGQGEPLILLHGGYGSMDGFVTMIPALSKKYKVIAVDSRSQGRTTDSDVKELSYAQMARDVNMFMDLLHIKKARLVGWSDGGDITLELAVAHPEKIEKAVVLGTNFLGEKYGVVVDADTSLKMDPKDPMIANTKAKLALYRSTYERVAPNKANIEKSKKKVEENALNNPNITIAQLNNIQVPIMVMVGDHDMFKIEHTVTLFKNLPKASLFVVPDATHLSPWEQPALVNSEILRYLSQPYRKIDALYWAK
jgi:pimeloyl-ACP methyl ester carboxylesterase